jgi:hypothetical protein
MNKTIGFQQLVYGLLLEGLDFLDYHLPRYRPTTQGCVRKDQQD